MALKKLISSLFKKADDSNSVYDLEVTEFGVRFVSPRHEECLQEAAPSFLQLQYVMLQMLVESGEASEINSGFFIADDGATQLSEEDRDLLNLPRPWPGRFELSVSGHTFSTNFSVKLNLLEEPNNRITFFEVKGPILSLGAGEEYLPSPAQMRLLNAVKQHEALPIHERTEVKNLLTVFELQQAQKEGARIDLRQFEKQKVDVPERIKVTTIENPDGSLRLVPDFESSLSPDEIERCLGQFADDDRKALRVSNRLVLLDETKLKAISEILSNRVIPAKERDQFLKTPAAFLDASLIDLDNGLSIRVHGAEVFQKAYFGESDGQSLSWFGEAENAPEVLTLPDCKELLKSRAELDEFKAQVATAVSEGKTSVQLKGKTILLPQSPGEIETTWKEFDFTISDKEDDACEACPKGESPSANDEQGAPNVTVKIDLHEEEISDDLRTLSADGKCHYSGEICGVGCKLSPFSYQEKGIRWILGLAKTALTLPEDKRFGGALLADDMGLGKTFMSLASLQVYQDMMLEQGIQKPILVVAPVVLLENWREEVGKVFEQSPFKDIVILQSGSDLPKFRQEGAKRETKYNIDDADPKSAIRYSLKVGKKFGNLRLDMPGRLVLTNYDTLRDYQFSMCMIDWGMVIFDEAQEIKNPNAMKSRAAKGLKADFRLAVTGTPVENDLNDFWSLYDTVSPGILGSYREFQKKYISPINKASVSESALVRLNVGQQLRKDVGELMLRRTKEEELDCLPPKIVHCGGGADTDSLKYTVEMSGSQLQRYNDIVASVAAVRATGDAQEIRKIVLPSLRKLRDVSLHPSLLDGGAPLLPSNRDNARQELEKSEKLRLLLDILDEVMGRDEKVIIFVMNKKLQRFLSVSLAMCYSGPISIINGETKSVASRSGKGKESRKQIIDRFQNKSGFGIIIMSPLAAGVGLTVTGANNVIHLERHWNPAKEAQATDRVYRIGATKDVHVYIPILTHPELKSFDSNLQELLGKKVDLKDAVVSPVEFGSDDFDKTGMFGDEAPSSGHVNSDWLPTMSWKNLEALAAIIAEREFNGAAKLTPVNDFGVDVVVNAPQGNILIQCKSTVRELDDPKVVTEAFQAGPEYEKRLGMTFSKSILCTNTTSIRSSVFDKAKTYNVDVWSGKELSTFLNKHEVLYADIEKKLRSPRVDLL